MVEMVITRMSVSEAILSHFEPSSSLAIWNVSLLDNFIFLSLIILYFFLWSFYIYFFDNFIFLKILPQSESFLFLTIFNFTKFTAGRDLECCNAVDLNQSCHISPGMLCRLISCTLAQYEFARVYNDYIYRNIYEFHGLPG